MKKILLSLGFACFGLAVSSNAQTIMSQNFESPTVAPALPATWSQQSTGSPAWQTSSAGGTTWGGLTGAYNIPAHTQYVVVDDAAHPTQLHDTLKSQAFDMSAYPSANVWLAYDYFFYNATNNSSGITETCEVLGSSDGGASWAIIDSVYGNAWDGSWSTAHTSLASLSGTNCEIAFAYSDNGGAILGCALDNILVSVPPANEIALTAVTPVAPVDYFQTGSSQSFGGTMVNNGYTTITTFQATYMVGAGTPVASTFSGISVAPFTSYNFTCTTPYTVASGTQTVTMWVTEAGDPVLSNDTMSTAIMGVDSLQPKTVLVEEFNQASCDPCAEATPNLDSVYVNNLSRSIMVRYHVNFPGRDCMDSVTLSPFVQTRINYYNVNGVPDAQVDGQYVYPGAAGPGSFSSDILQPEAAFGSPFKITVTPTYVPATQTFSFTANIESYSPMPAGLTAFAALTIDTITYAHNQSTESIPQTEFPEVAENMFPAAGTTLTAFTSGSTQTITGTWTKNHNWGSDFAVWSYDSTATGKIVVWVEDGTNKFVYQAGYATMRTALRTAGVNAVAGNSGSLDVYPNPANNTATVALTLKNDANVKMEVYNMLGQVVCSMPSEHRNAGASFSTINVSNYASGQYFVKVLVGNELLTKTLVVTK